MVDFNREPIDVGIRFGPGPYPGLLAEKLLDDYFVVVAAPAKGSRLKKPADLLRQTLLFDDHEDAWARCFAALGFDGADPDSLSPADRLQPAGRSGGARPRRRARALVADSRRAVRGSLAAPIS